MPRRQTASRRPGQGAGVQPLEEERSIEGLHARGAEPLKDGVKHDHLAGHAKQANDRQEALLDEALEETFPSSDPISPKHIT
jgi:hypothetical protein